MASWTSRTSSRSPSTLFCQEGVRGGHLVPGWCWRCWSGSELGYLLLRNHEPAPGAGGAAVAPLPVCWEPKPGAIGLGSVNWEIRCCLGSAVDTVLRPQARRRWNALQGGAELRRRSCDTGVSVFGSDRYRSRNAPTIRIFPTSPLIFPLTCAGSKEIKTVCGSEHGSNEASHAVF